MALTDRARRDGVVRLQRGVLSQAQADGLFGRERVRWLVTAERWNAPLPGVVVCHNAPLDAAQRAWAALLAAPHGSALGGWSALAFDGWVIDEDAPVLVLIPAGARRPRISGVTFAHSAALGERDVHPAATPRRTRPPRSLVDVAVRRRSPAAARLVLLQGVQQGLASVDGLAEILESRGQCRHLGVLTETVADIRGGARSVPEVQFARLVRRYGLPEPARQVVARRPDGRYYLDADWPHHGVSAEVDGAHHRHAGTLDRDWVRHNELTVGGRRVLHFTSYAVRHRPLEVARTLAGALSVPLRGDLQTVR